MIFRFHLIFWGVPDSNSLDGIPSSRSIWGYDLLILVSEIPTVPWFRQCSWEVNFGIQLKISRTSSFIVKFWWDGTNTYLLGSCGHTTFGKSLLTLCPWLKYDGQNPSFLLICRISRVQASWVVTVRELVHHQIPSCLYVFVELSWRKAENNDMILDKATFLKVEFAMRFVQDGHREFRFECSDKECLPHRCFLADCSILAFCRFEGPAGVLNIKHVGDFWTTQGIDLTVMPFNTWQMVKTQMRDWKGKSYNGLWTSKGRCWDLHAEPGRQGVCGVWKPHESIGFRMTTSNILHCARGECMEMLHSSQKRIRTFCFSAAQEHRSGLRVRDLVAAHAVAKGWTANSALFVFFRPFQTTTSGAGRFSLLRFWKLVVLETRGSWICPKSHCQQNHQHYFKMLKAFQWWCCANRIFGHLFHLLWFVMEEMGTTMEQPHALPAKGSCLRALNCVVDIP